MFLGYYLNSEPVNRQKSSKGQGDAVVHITANALADIDLMMPTIEEQATIASVLSDMDAEIDALELKLEKARQLKQGMMHNLLTGKIRLVDGDEISEKGDAEKSVNKRHNWQIDEAVLIAVLTKNFGSEQYPLGRKRRTKLLYLFHRYMAQEAIGFKKKAAGPYNPEIRYGGPEKIALQRSYVCEKSAGNYQGFVLSENFAEADNYFNQWYDPKELDWLEQFRYSKNDELELLTTVDMAMVDLKKAGAAITLHSVKQVIGDHPEWVPKLQRSIFSDEQITFTIERCKQLFYPDYE
jgi:type I restriction enzyme S subunit